MIIDLLKIGINGLSSRPSYCFKTLCQPVQSLKKQKVEKWGLSTRPVEKKFSHCGLAHTRKTLSLAEPGKIFT
jgi:hypothetical protein